MSYCFKYKVEILVRRKERQETFDMLERLFNKRLYIVDRIDERGKILKLYISFQEYRDSLKCGDHFRDKELMKSARDLAVAPELDKELWSQ